MLKAVEREGRKGSTAGLPLPGAAVAASSTGVNRLLAQRASTQGAGLQGGMQAGPLWRARAQAHNASRHMCTQPACSGVPVRMDRRLTV